MKTSETRLENILKLSESLGAEMSALTKDIDSAKEDLRQIEMELRDVKQAITLLKTNASESSKFAKKLESLRKERRKAKKLIQVYEEMESLFTHTMSHTNKLKKELAYCLNHKPSYVYRSAEVQAFMDSIHNAKERADVKLLPFDKTRNRNEEIVQPNIFSFPVVKYRISLQKGSANGTWKMENLFTGVTVFEGSQFKNLVKAIDDYQCKRLEFVSNAKNEFLAKINSAKHNKTVQTDFLECLKRVEKLAN